MNCNASCIHSLAKKFAWSSCPKIEHSWVLVLTWSSPKSLEQGIHSFPPMSLSSVTSLPRNQKRLSSTLSMHAMHMSNGKNFYYNILAYFHFGSGESMIWGHMSMMNSAAAWWTLHHLNPRARLRTSLYGLPARESPKSVSCLFVFLLHLVYIKGYLQIGGSIRHKIPESCSTYQVLFKNEPRWLGPNTCNNESWWGSAPLDKHQHCPQNITPQGHTIVSNCCFIHIVTDSGCNRAWECDEQMAAEIESSHMTGVLKNHCNDAYTWMSQNLTHINTSQQKQAEAHECEAAVDKIEN